LKLAGLKIHGSNLCVAPETLLLTSTGYKPIYSLAGHWVHVWNGEEWSRTKVYKTADAGPTFTGNWIRQIIAVAQDYPKTQFVRVVGPTTAEIAEFAGVENMQSLSFADFVSLINTIPKDL
jgi:hypothetical protein